MSIGIEKAIQHPGNGDIPSFIDGTKVLFHYQTRLCNCDMTILDDSRKHKRGPMSLYYGKSFKLPIWEKCIASMRVKEVASFICDPQFVDNYPMVSKSLRDIEGNKSGGHCCGMTISEQGFGYKDLDELAAKPQKLEFIIELLSVEVEGKYKKESWIMNNDEKINAIPRIKIEGNALFKKKMYKEASQKYGEAVSMLDGLCTMLDRHQPRTFNDFYHSYHREKPGDDEYNAIDIKKIPFYLNHAQCQLLLHNYYEVITYTNEVLTRDPDNVKALFRKSKAQLALGDFDLARKGFNRTLELDESLSETISKELECLKKESDLKISEEKNCYNKLFK